MTTTDWLVIVLVLVGIILYGLYKSRTTKNIEGYFLSNRSLPWYLVLLSIMGTQASAITFLSGPGQAFADGMRFVQYYFGLPLAMIVICVTFVPMFSRLKVVTAYEFLEKRFDNKTRTLTSFLFLLQRGLSTGISIYAPSLILSSLFGWNIFWINIFMGGLLIIYTVTGGAKAVAHTQKIQLIIIFIAMFAAGYMVVHLLPAGVGMADAFHISGNLDRLNIITSGQTPNGFDWNDKYNMWSGVIGGFFLALSYFGTDHSQVGRYLTAQNKKESRLGLIMNGFIKVPMQFFILLVGVLVFAFYQFHPAPLSFNESLLQDVQQSSAKDAVGRIQHRYDSVNTIKKGLIGQYITQLKNNGSQNAALENQIKSLNKASEVYRKEFKKISATVSSRDSNDTNYVFLSWAKTYLPSGLKGLLIAIIFLAAWGSIAAALNSLAASTVVDFHQRIVGKEKMLNEYIISKWYTLGWGLFCILVAQFANQIGQSLIEAVNILGSLFYGVILGIFLIAFYFKNVRGTATFIAALITEVFIILLFFNEKFIFLQWLPDISFLWLNGIGAVLLVLIAILLNKIFNK